MKKYILLIVALLVVGCGGQEDVEAYKNEITRLSTENEALKGQVEELRTINTVVAEESNALLNELQEELNSLKNENSQSGQANSDKIKKLESEKSNLAKKVSQKDKLIKDLKSEIANLETSNKLLNNENDKLKDQTERLKVAEKGLQDIIEENRQFFKNNPNISVEKKQELNRIEKKAKDAFDELDAEIANY